MLTSRASSRTHRSKFPLLLSFITSFFILSSATAFAAQIKLAWDYNTDADLAGKYDKVYMHKADDPSDPWKIYDAFLPAYVNDLTTIEPGFAYWINVKENCNLVVNN